MTDEEKRAIPDTGWLESRRAVRRVLRRFGPVDRRPGDAGRGRAAGSGDVEAEVRLDEARERLASGRPFWARAEPDSPIGAKCVRVWAIADDLDPPLLLWSAQPLWFGDAGAGGGIWPPDSLTALPAGEKPAWHERHGI